MRNFGSLSISGYKFVQSYDLFRVADHIYYKLQHKTKQGLHNTYFLGITNRIAGNHFFNSISFDHKPWVTTFETLVPRLGRMGSFYHGLAVKQIVSAYCRSIIPISQSANDIMCSMLSQHYPDLMDAVKAKMTIIHPPQKVYIHQKNGNNAEKVHFLFVGRQFFRKGGMEMLIVFDKLIEKGYPIHLTIVSNIEFGDYITKTTDADKQAALSIIHNHPESITHYTKLKNDEVIALFKQVDVSLLPTLQDTYGYSVLESQACGCPVISTDLRALSEINSEETGWIIPVKHLGYSGETEVRKVISEQIISRLESIVLNVIEYPESIVKKGNKSIDRIEKYHNPENVSKKLRKIYDTF